MMPASRVPLKGEGSRIISRLRRVFNLSGSEIVVILLLALVVLGPEKLPDAIRRFGRTYGELKRMSTSFQDEMRSTLEEPMREMRETADLLREQADFTRYADEKPQKPKSGNPMDEAEALHAADDVDPIDDVDEIDDLDDSGDVDDGGDLDDGGDVDDGGDLDDGGELADEEASGDDAEAIVDIGETVSADDGGAPGETDDTDGEHSTA